jgi:hypothetical protein
MGGENMRMRFRDLFALVVWGTSLVIYVLVAAGYKVPDIVLGQLVTLDTLVVQFYFRKKPSEERVENGKSCPNMRQE